MRKYGIWIDTKGAWIAELTANGSLTEILLESGAKRKPRIPGESSRKTIRGIKGFDYERNQNAHFEEHLKKFLRLVMARVKAPAEVVVLGPGEVKHRLAKILREQPGMAVRLIKAVDKVTINQKRKMVKEFFMPVK